MEDPIFSNLISFIWISDSQFIGLPVNCFYTLYQQPFIPRRKATKSSSRENHKNPNTSATTQNDKNKTTVTW